VSTRQPYRRPRGQVAKDMSLGERYGLVVVVRAASGLGGARWVVLCDCGKERVVHGGNLRKKPPTTHRGCK